MNKKHAGAKNEHLGIAHLLSEGYEVFRNVSQHGLIDVLALRDGKILRADIKGVQARKDGSLRRGRLSREQIAAEIISIAVHPDNSVHIDLAPRRVATSSRAKA
jgi:hypothetical protein